jgi:hypothetical protein
MASPIGKELEQTLVGQGIVVSLFASLDGSRWSETMYLRYAFVGCCFVAAIILITVSSNSYQGTDECRNRSARSVTSLLIPCAAKAEVDEPFNIGAAPIEQQDSQTKR